MMKCICGEVLDSRTPVTVLRRPCLCGLPPRTAVTFGAPHVFIRPRNPERERAGLPDKTDLEKSLDSRWV